MVTRTLAELGFLGDTESPVGENPLSRFPVLDATRLFYGLVNPFVPFLSNSDYPLSMLAARVTLSR